MAKLIYIYLLISSFSSISAKDQIGPDLNDKNAIKAFQVYWDAFDEYEKKVLKEGKQKFSKSILEVEQNKFAAEQAISNQQIEHLNSSIRKYQRQLEKHADAYNQPYVMLNLARVLFLKSKKLKVIDESDSIEAAEHALVVLADIERNFPNFDKREEALYTKATVNESIDRNGDAVKDWKYLASIASQTMYGAHAFIAIGDHYFRKERADISYNRYISALNIFRKLELPSGSKEYVKLNYRLIWAAYRSANLRKAVEFGLDLLHPGIEVKRSDKKKLIQADAVTVIGDSLFEEDDMTWTRSVLKKKSVLNFSSAIGLRVLERYVAASLFRRATFIGDYLVQEFPASLEIPRILSKVATSYKRLKKASQSIAALEKLSLLLPKHSLWRSRYRHELDQIEVMQKLALMATKVVSAWHYDKGMTTGNIRSFKTAAAFYQSLVDYTEAEPGINHWRLRVAHCYYFAGNLEEAVMEYQQLKTKYNVTPEILQVAAYQQVLSYEKLWRQAYGEALSRGDSPKEDISSNRALKSLESSVDSFANKFDSEGRSVDLLLVTASALRDQGYFDRASVLWQRALVSKPNVSQRALAIRGLVFASMKEGGSLDVINTVRKFLKMEDWSQLGKELNYELASVLSTATLEEGKRLNDSGELQKAGKILVEIAKEYPGIPERPKILRDGAYLLALGGLWVESEETADMFLKSNIKQYRGDMIYLLARSNEFQIRFDEAAKYYVELGTKFPNHKKSKTSLIRGEKLSEAENNYLQAGVAAELLGNRERDLSQKLYHYKRAFDYYMKVESFSEAINAADRRIQFSKKVSDINQSKLMRAVAVYSSGRETRALREVKIVADDARRNRRRMTNDQWSSIAGESNFILGDEERQKFDDFDIFERSGSSLENLKIKSRYFASLNKFFQVSESTGHPEWAMKSRYYLAKAAEDLSSNISGVLKENNNRLSSNSRRNYEMRRDRLDNIAKQLYTKNIIAKRKSPSKYRSNKWAKKSSIALGELGHTTNKQSQEDMLPNAVSMELPGKWSL